ncbi:sperm-associated antigen 1 isoform X2 [Hyla sarda]|uniref:sperm-associated antigen 1 isoform X2 n=1 Tax=Hyla sarda TaxID=327740 RepID=UPI0024C43050|nr:sperm-associated antigen 1 isoform X2 [Hyla sarda]
MSGYYQGTTKTHQIPVDHLDYKFIEECKDVKHLEKILRVLRLGEEGLYPDLTAFCEKRIEALSPNNRALRKDKPPATAADFSLEDWQEIGGDLKNFLTEIKLTEQRPPFQQTTDNLPPIRNSSNAPATNKKGKEYQSAGSKVPRDYRDWDRLDIEKELSEIDKSKDNVEQSKTVINTTASKIKKNVATKGISLEQKRSLAEREKDKGNEAFRSGDFEEAILYYSRSISVLPTAVAYNNRAQTEIKLKNWQNALKDCDHALDLEPENVKALLRRAVVNKNLSNFQAASSDLQTILLHEPENPIAKKVLCEVEELQQKEKAEKSKKGRRIVIQDIEGSDEEHQDTSVKEKEAGVTVGGGETAAEPTEMGNAQKKFSPKKGYEKEEVKQSPRHSKENTQNGVKKDNSNGKPQNHPGQPEQISGKAALKARTGSQEAKLSPQPLPLAAQLKNEGNLLFKNGQFGEASVKYSEAIENLKNAGSEDAEELGILYSNRAACHLKDGNCAQCIEDCSNALELQPFSLKPLLRRAMANESLEKYRQAYVDYKVALQIDSGMQLANDSINRLTRTLIDLDGDNWREKLPPIPSVPVSTQLQHQEKNMATTNARAEKEMGKSIEERFLSLKQEGNDYVKKCQYKEAEKRYTECLVLKPEECTVYTNRALCYLKLCQYEEARQDCECALQRDASNVKALYRRAQAYKGLKKYQDCARDLQKLLSVDPGVTEAKTLLTEITPLLSTNGEEKQRKKILIEEVEEKEKTSNPSNVDEDKDSLRKTHSSGITKPSNALEFEQLLNGMRAGKDQEGCAHLLSIIDPKDLPVFLSNKLDTETLLLIVQSLKHHVLEKNPALVYRHLAHLSSADRFSVVVLLLNQDEKDQVQSVLTSLSGMENENFDRDAISNLTKTYGL